MQKHPLIAPLLLIAIGAGLFFCVGQVEAPIVAGLWKNPWPAFRDFMANSVYEGDTVGASDFGVTAAIVCFFIWLYRRKTGSQYGNFSNDNLKFIWLSSFLTAIVTVHSLKWIIVRLRPHVFFDTTGQQLLTMENLHDLSLPGFLPLLGPRGIGLNSFPSGHTASCAILLTFSYVLWPKNRAISIIFGLVVLIFAATMAAARSMAGMHWLSDSVASIFLTWALIHYNWHRICKKKSSP